MNTNSNRFSQVTKISERKKETESTDNYIGKFELKPIKLQKSIFSNASSFTVLHSETVFTWKDGASRHFLCTALDLYNNPPHNVFGPKIDNLPKLTIDTGNPL